ncbi:MAG TPA: hypothetical protein VFW62_02865 [bacterium]|nr:hypothetical protein [bacterium]
MVVVKSLCLALLLAGLPLGQVLAWTLEVETPPFAALRSTAAKITSKPDKGLHKLELPEGSGETSLEIRGPLGGWVRHPIGSADAGKTLRFEAAIVAGDDPNPTLLPNLPALCPRLEIQTGRPNRYLYRGESDSLNRFPITHMTDPDKTEGRQAESVRLIDGRNVLLLKSLRLSYDYEDDAIIDERKTDPKTGQSIEVREGRGGFYANFHYAVLPYDPAVSALPEQTLLHLAQGSLNSIDQAQLRPELRVHGFLPGPFLSRSSFGYPLCEWGDTAHQAPEQSLDYRGIALWDWDYAVKPAERVLLIVWEGDEEDQARAQGLIDPTRLIDDLVGVFEVSRSASLKPLKLRNSRGDFELTVQTGSFPGLEAPPAPSLPLAENPAPAKPAGAMTGN